MTDSGTRCLEMLIRVRQFTETHAASFPEGSVGREMCDEVAAAVSEIESQATAQDSGKRAGMEGTTLKSVAEERLRRTLAAVRDTAREMARKTPGMEEKFRIPRGGGDQALLTLARSFAQDASPLKDEFARWGMPNNFLDELDAEIADFERSINDRTQKRGEQVAATAAIDAALERGVAAVRSLDAVVRNTFRDERGVLAEWTSASHVERQARTAPTQTTAGASGPKQKAPAAREPA